MSEPGAPPKLLLLGWDSQDNHKVDVRQVIVEQRFKLTTTALRPGGPVRAVLLRQRVRAWTAAW